METSHYHTSRPRFGVFSSWFHGDYQFEFVSGIEYEAHCHDVDIAYFTGRSLHSSSPYKYNHTSVYDIPLDASLDGLVIMPGLIHYCTSNQVDEFISRYASIPLVTISYKTTSGNAILIDNAGGFRELLKHLIEDHGYWKFAFINGPATNYDIMKRTDIYTSVLRSYGISIDPSHVINSYFTYNSGKRAVAAFFDDREVRPGKDIEVIVCASDLIARGAMEELANRGIEVPSGIAITGFDGIRYSLFPIPPLTTVRQYIFEIGRTAILNLLDYDPGREDILFNTAFIINSSCGCTESRQDNEMYSYTSNQNSPAMQHPALKPVDREILKSIISGSGQRKNLEFFFLDIMASIDNLKLLKNIDEFNEWFTHTLPVFGIKQAYLFMYTDSPSFSNSVTLTADYTQEKKKPDNRGTIYPLYSVLDEILTGDERRSYCILPILHKDEQYGLLVMEVNLHSSIVYNMVSTQIGNRIKSLLLIEEVTTMNRKLEETNTMLRQANEQKTRFYINIAHETKTPLTLIQNYLERYLENQQPAPDLAVVRQNIDILLKNIINFLDAERLAKGTMPYSHDTCIDLSEFTQKKCMLFKSVAMKKDITINSHVENNVLIKIDPLALDRIVNNLMDNAVKYTQKGGTVRVIVGETAGKAVLQVKDSGPGLSGTTLSHLFESYYQLSQKGSGRQGTGVGLSIVKQIIDDIGATITVSNSKNRGACFTINFIKNKETEAPAVLDTIPFADPSPGILTGGKIAEEDISRDKASILIVEDNIQMLDFLRMSLKKMYNVYLATDVLTALAKLKIIKRPDLIISDIMMENMDGHELLARITGTEEYCDIPFIFLTASSGKDEEVRGLAGGAIDYIKKPFSMTELEKKIQSIVTLRKRMKKHEIKNIRKGIDILFSRIEDRPVKDPGTILESLCTKYNISAREKKIITLVLKGLLNKEIALQLHLSQRAVEYHITKIFKKVGVSKRYELLKMFRM